MNPLVRFAVRKLDQKCQNLEAGIEADHRIPDDVLEDLDMPFQGAEGVPLAADIFRPKDRGLRKVGCAGVPCVCAGLSKSYGNGCIS